MNTLEQGVPFRLCFITNECRFSDVYTNLNLCNVCLSHLMAQIHVLFLLLLKFIITELK